jgi:uncharacterized protein (DUF342 family)
MAPPPAQLIRFFQMAPNNYVLANQRLFIANNLAIGENERTISMVEELEESCNTLKRVIDCGTDAMISATQVWSDMNERIKAQRVEATNVRRMLVNLQTSIQPQETELSVAFLAENPNQEDVDHA